MTSSDHGSQYLSIRYTERLREAGIEPSVGSVGDPYDNALAESVIGLYKTEVIAQRGPWHNLRDVEFATLEWVNWFGVAPVYWTLSCLVFKLLPAFRVRQTTSAQIHLGLSA